MVGQVIGITEFETDITFSWMGVLGLIAVLLALVLLYASQTQPDSCQQRSSPEIECSDSLGIKEYLSKKDVQS